LTFVEETMRFHVPFHDAVLGHVIWNAQENCWGFDAGPVNGRPVPTRYLSSGSPLSLAERDWDGVRDCVQWIRANEPTVRAFIREKVHNPTPLPWELWLTGINFYNDNQAQLVYGTYLVVIVQISAAGQILGSKVLVSG
jgi:hypothetical protein